MIIQMDCIEQLKIYWKLKKDVVKNINNFYHLISNKDVNGKILIIICSNIHDYNGNFKANIKPILKQRFVIYVVVVVINKMSYVEVLLLIVL